MILPVVVALWGCGPGAVDPEVPADPYAASLQARMAAVEAQRQALRAAESELLRGDVDQALDDGRLDRAVSLVVATGRGDQDPVRARVVQAVRARVDTDPDQAARLLGLLGLEAEAEAAGVRARYGPGLARTRDQVRGVTVAMAARVLGMLQVAWLREPDWERMHAAGARRLGLLVQQGVDGFGTDGARRALAEVPQATPVALVGWLEGVAAATGRPGMVVSEWVDAACASLDPWTRAVWPAEVKSWEAHHQGVSLGVGLELEAVDGEVVVSMPILGGPAWRAGLHQRDVLVAVTTDGREVPMAAAPEGERVAVATALLAGEPGSTVALAVRRGDGALAFTLARQAVPEEVVRGWARAADNSWDPWVDVAHHVAYVHLSAFRPDTDEAFDALVAPVLDDVEAVILDLRGNTGGDVDAAVQIADRWVADGELAGLEGRQLPVLPTHDPETGEALVPWNHAVPGHGLEGVPTVVLVDPETASAAEILAGALQAHDVAEVLGQRTFGKGRSQVLRVDEELGFGLQLTNLAWTLPDGRGIHGEEREGGIAPDIPTSATSAERYAFGVLRERREAPRVHHDGTPMEYVGPRTRPELPPLDEDPEVLRALIHLHRGRSGHRP